MAGINEYIQLYKERILEDLDRLVSFKSYSDDRECCKETLKYILDLAKSFGMETTLGKYGDVGLIDLKSAEPENSKTLGILVHVDVVPEGDLEKWHVEPFRLTRENGNLYGRGIVDDKGPVITSLYALKYIKDSGIRLKKNIRMIVGTSEEITWTDMDHYKEEFECPDFGYSPDGVFPIYNRENGYMDVELIFNEILSDRVLEMSGGSAVNSVPSTAWYTTIEGKKVTASGKAAHSSTPELGINAICLLAEKMKEEMPCDFASFITEYFPLEAYCSNISYLRTDGKYNDSDDLSIIPTTLKMEDGRIHVNFNVRQSYMIPGKNIVAGLSEKAEAFNFDINVKESLEPIWVKEENPWIERLKKVTENNGIKGECLLAKGCSYAKSMPEFVSWGPVFEGEPDCAHMEDEVQPEESFFKTLKMYIEYISEETAVN